MSNTSISSLAFTSQKITIYCGIPVLIIGLLGGFLLTIVLLSLETFRQNSCAFCLTIMSIFHTVNLMVNLTSRILVTGFNIDWTTTSLFYCKFRIFLSIICPEMSSTCLCLATLDQYFATCSRPRWQQWCNIKLVRRLITLFLVIWLLHSIPYFIFFNQILSVSTGALFCTSTNNIFNQYRIYFVGPVLSGCVPLFMVSFLGIMTYRNVQSLNYRAVPLVRRELDKQLTVIVITQVTINVITTSPAAIINAVTNNRNITNDQVIWDQLQFLVVIAALLYYIYYASPLYICMCVSKRFRRQVMFVLSKIFNNQWRQPNIIPNQVVPQSQ